MTGGRHLVPCGVGWKSRTVVAFAMILAGFLGAPRGAPPEPDLGPPRSPQGPYVSSDACQSCHPAEHASWHRTYHRTMTAPARADLVRGPDAELELDGLRYAIRRRGEEVFVTLPEPEALAARAAGGAGGVPSVERRLELSTGSHHYQGYWLPGHAPGELRMFPFVYVFAEGRWLPRRDVFLQPPDATDNLVRWSSNCIQCHTTGGEPGRDLGSGAAAPAWSTRVAELGVACEACHGPGEQHVRRYRDPLARYEAYAAGEGGEDITNPARLPADRASMVCGQCHAFTYPKDEDEWWRRGYTRTFRPGDDLEATRFLLVRDPSRAAPRVDADVESMFWPDGTVRVGGREYSGMILSACFLRAPAEHPERRLSCLSCHAMHASEPEGQVAKDHAGNLACLGCHVEAKFKERLTEHTHHLAGSSGSLCASCHMPRTTYALLKAIPSHRIDSPAPRGEGADLAGARPSACNLCHLDRSLAWTDAALRRWSGLPADAVAVAGGEGEPAGPAWLLAGDAAVRVIAAAAFGAAGAREATGAGWQAPLLARALADPYVAVRIVALRSLRALPGYEDILVDPLAPDDARARARQAIVELWQRRGGAADLGHLDALVARRDERAISISE